MTARLRQLIKVADPAGSLTLTVKWLAEQLEHVEETAPVSAAPPSWRTLLWEVHDDVLLGVTEIAEALDHPVSWVYRRTGPAGIEPRLPVQKMGGEIVIRAADLRRWVKQQLEPMITISRRRRA
jgi:hypothetical protein